MTVHAIKALIQSHHPLIVIDTVEEERVLEFLESVCSEIEVPLFTWSIARGLAKFPSKHAFLASTNSPLAALRHLDELAVEGVFLFGDFARHLEDPDIAHQLLDILQRFNRSRSCFVITGHPIRLPYHIETEAMHYDLQLTDKEELSEVINTALRSLTREHEVGIDLNPTERCTLLNALGSMTLNQARQCIASAMIEDRVLNAADISRALDRKAKLIRDNGLLEYFPVLDNSSQLGGFDYLEKWLDRTAAGFAPEAKALDLCPPRGILLAGLRGCGKSLAAKAIARRWNTPLLKLDAASLYKNFLGETERNFRKAVKLAESISPVVLWIDEIERAFATGNASNGGAASGASHRMLGSFLTWLQEKKESVFVVATANDLDILPAELLQKGRFDEVFFVDLPETEERVKIFEIHLQLKKQNPASFDIAKLAEAAGGFSGAEIEQAVVAALYRSLFLKRPLDTEFIFQEILETIPFSVSRSEEIARLRKHARGRFVNVRGEPVRFSVPSSIAKTAAN